MKTTLIAALAASCLLAPLALAGPAPSATVSYADLDVNSPAGRAEAVKRIETAAQRLCRHVPEPAHGGLAAMAERQECVKLTTDAAAAKLPAPVRLAQTGR